MKLKTKDYVQTKTLREIAEKADIILLVGVRSGGKSFAVRRLVIEDAYKGAGKFAYLRRYDIDAKDSNAGQYFTDCPYISTLTEDKMQSVNVYHHNIYLAHFDDDKLKTKNDILIGRSFALSTAEHYKSQSFPDYNNIIYEEFITDNAYLPDECTKLQNFMSTIFRDRPNCKTWLIGNKLSRMCPYFREWGLTKTVKQENGTVEYYTMDSGTRIAVYMTDTTKHANKLFFGNASKQITKGEWETKEFPHLENFADFKPIYTCVLLYQGNKFLMQFGNYKKGFVWYVQPKNTEVQPHTRTINPIPNADPLSTTTFRGLTEQEQYIFSLLKANEIVFSDNLTGTEFHQCFDNVR